MQPKSQNLLAFFAEMWYNIYQIIRCDVKDRKKAPVFLLCQGGCSLFCCECTSNLKAERMILQRMKLKKFGGTESKIYALVQPIAEEQGLIVWDVRFEKEGAMWYLRILLDHMERAVNITDCENVTRPLNKLLDELDPIPQSYTLEVGSAGLERELIRETHFDACEGCKIRLRLIRPAADGAREITGTLISCDRENVTVQTDSGETAYPLSGVAFVRLADLDADEISRAAAE